MGTGGKKQRAKGTRPRRRIKVEIPREGGEGGGSERERERAGEVKADEENDDRVESRGESFDRKKRARGKKPRGARGAGRRPASFVNQKISRRRVRLNNERVAGVKGRIVGPPLVNCIAGACTFCREPRLNGAIRKKGVHSSGVMNNIGPPSNTNTFAVDCEF